MTTPDITDLSPEQLKSELSWLRGLASRLVREADVAEDLVQDTLVVALQRPGGGRPFLAGVLRNLSLRRGRGEARRRVRERRGARPEAVDSAAELVKEIANQRELVSAVLRLDEPYRETLLLRFYRDLSPKRIAAQSGVSVNTVNSRLQRGLAQLRSGLDAEYGDRRTWCLALLPLVDPPPPPAWPIVGAVTVKTTLAAAALVAAVSAGVLIPLLSGPEEAATATGALTADLAVASVSQPSVLDGSEPLRPADMERSVGAGRTAVVRTGLAAADDGQPQPAATLVNVRGRVVDVDGLPVAGVTVSARADGRTQQATSGDGGAFVLEATPEDQVTIRVEGDDWVALREGFWDTSRQFEPIVLVARPLELAGRVVDVFGTPVGEARLDYRLPSDLTTRVGLDLDSTVERTWQARTDADGRYRLSAVPRVEGALVGVVHTGYAARFLDAPLRSAENFDVVLEPDAMLSPLAIRGRVVDGEGRPVEGALVSLGATVGSTDRVGVFQLDPVRALDTSVLKAARAGFLPAALQRPGEPSDDDTGWPSFTTLTLGGASLSIAGVLVDQDGEPVAGARVWVDDGEPFGAVGAYPLQLEAILAGGAPPADGFGMQAQMPTADGDERFGWYTLPSEPDGMWFYTTTDAGGAFVLEGLTDRDYTLAAVLDEPLARVTSGPFAAGSEGVVVEVDVPEVHTTLRGRVVDERGEPVSDIRLQLYEITETKRARVLGGSTEMNLLVSQIPEGTDEEGRFELPMVPVEGAYLWATGDGILPTPRSIPADVDPENWVLELPCRRRLQVELALSERADGFEVLAADGSRLPLYETSASAARSTWRAAIVEGVSSIQSVGLAARTLRLWSGEELVEEVPVNLSAEGVNTIRL
ncbi:sigma-70 family RNA polymerase sigma factor [Engelhardtia mirabilis]|uniref:RNA polymerase sigma factor n=1 Tax=Engelhardtia mirabilis TaxID=2528011 RepID=A0A518BGC4_9BACT|nr:RNA polymerase sigma factor [Planctomycetes bacterium Pla133]QDV00309.1 RNA polymerase sigma factor [Planctomycetes bacterium Pla86]